MKVFNDDLTIWQKINSWSWSHFQKTIHFCFTESILCQMFKMNLNESYKSIICITLINDLYKHTPTGMEELMIS